MPKRYIDLRFRGGRWESTSHSGTMPQSPTWSVLPGGSQLDIRGYITRQVEGDNRVRVGGVSAGRGQDLSSIYTAASEATVTPSPSASQEAGRFARATESFAAGPTTPATAGPTPVSGIPEPQYDNYWEDSIGTPVAAGTPGAVHNTRAFLSDMADWQQVTGNEPGAPGGVGPRGPTAAELAIERSKVQAQNLATFVSGTIAELETEIDAKRLSTEQAIGEFNRRLDAFSEAGAQFQGIQPYTIPIGAEYIPGFQPGGIGERLGIEPEKAQVIQFDPFAMANQIVEETPVLTDIGVPSTDALSEAIELARGFVGG